MKSRIVLAISISFATMSLAHAETPIVCKGKNLMLESGNEKVATAIHAESKAIAYGDKILWRVTPPKNLATDAPIKPSYLFGTMHMSDPRLLELPVRAETAFDGSDTLAIEVTEILDPKAMAAKAQELAPYTIYLDGTSLADRLDEPQQKLVQANLEKRTQLPWAFAQRMRPWALMGAMALPACESARKASGKPILDKALADRAVAAKMSIVGLETIEGQLKAMASLPEKDMIDALVQTSKMGDRVDDVLETMIALYDTEQIGAIWTMMQHIGPDGLQDDIEDAGYSEFQRVIVDARNVTMADAAEPLIQKGGAFIAVGALHLPGDKGLLSILAQRGYTVSAD